MLNHVSTSIEYLLGSTDKFLGWMFEGSGSKIRKQLEERKAAGELFIGSANCEGFCPINGCPGHEVKEVQDV